MSVAAIVQARMGSSRLPGKVLAEIAGKPMLWHVVRRAQRAKTLAQVVVATSMSTHDAGIARFCDENEIACFRGDENDVLDRYHAAAKEYRADVVVRLTADCPLLDPDVIDRVVRVFLQGEWDYVSNTLRPTFPDGLDVEVFSFDALHRAWSEAEKPSEREHVTSYLRAPKFRTRNVACERDLSRQRWTVDDASDLEFVRAVYNRFAEDFDFGMDDVLALLESDARVRALQGQSVMNEGYYRTLYDQARAGSAPPLELSESRAWLERARRVIPGCAQTFSKAPEQYVCGTAPVFLRRGKGCRVWDVDGNEYVDYVQGLLPNILGYANDEVNAAAIAQLGLGHSFSLPHPLEVELAERLTRLFPCAETVRFGKNGSDATTAAVRAARAFTHRERVACCGYHGWHDWFIGSTTRNEGVPTSTRALTHPFPYNDLSALENVLREHEGEFAAVIMEPFNFIEPLHEYLSGVRELAYRHGALLIFDEICSGFHFGLGGAQKLFGVTPDMACLGKAMGNGFPISCVVGRRDVMQVFESIFFSGTFGGEVASMAAAMKVLDILEETDALAHMEAQGRRLQDGFNALSRAAGLGERLSCVGRASWSLLKFRDAAGNEDLVARSLFSQEAARRGVLLLLTHNMTAAHDNAAIEHTLESYAAIFKTLSGWLSEPDPSRFLEGEMIRPVFRVR